MAWLVAALTSFLTPRHLLGASAAGIAIAFYVMCDLPRTHGLRHKPARWFFRQSPTWAFGFLHFCLGAGYYVLAAPFAAALVGYLLFDLSPKTVIDPRVLNPPRLALFTAIAYLVIAYSRTKPGKMPPRNRSVLSLGFQPFFDLVRYPFEEALRKRADDEADPLIVEAQSQLAGRLNNDFRQRAEVVEVALYWAIRHLSERDRPHRQAQLDSKKGMKETSQFVAYEFEVLSLLSASVPDQKAFDRAMNVGFRSCAAQAGPGQIATLQPTRSVWPALTAVAGAAGALATLTVAFITLQRYLHEPVSASVSNTMTAPTETPAPTVTPTGLGQP